MSETLTFRLLGALEIAVGDRQLQLAAPRLQSVLGMLLLRADKTVPLQLLAECVWEDRPPADTNNQIAVCVSLLRRKLARAGVEGNLITTESPGYRFHTRNVQLDTHQVKRLRKEATDCLTAGNKEEAAGLLRQALSLWRGPLLASISRRAWVPDVRAWEEEQMALREMCTGIELELGQYDRCISELSGFIQEHPLFERPRAQLMTALYHSGRQADALQVYRDTSDLLNSELAVAPGRELQQLHQDILRGSLPTARGSAHLGASAGATSTADRLVTGGSPPLSSPAVAAVSSSPAVPVPEDMPADPMPPVGPCLLPADIREFVGREAEVAAVLDILVPSEGPAHIVGVVGAGGTGKTTLALHVAHRLRPVFAEGQLYINLRGMDPDPVAPEEALARLLRELGVPGPAIPDGVEERAERYRALLADQRVLIVLDNAASAEQIRPLLPGTGSCGVLITSRTRISSTFTPNIFELSLLTPEQAVDLLGRIAGAERPRADPDAARLIIEHCGRLPLAVSIVGAKLASRPHWSLDRASARLADERRRLDELSHDQVTVRTSLGPSYQGVSPGARLLLRRLTLPSLPDFAEWVAAPLLDLPAVKAETIIEELMDARLIEVMGTDRAGQLRYRMHDLVRLYASERAMETEAESERREPAIRVALTALAMAVRAHHVVCGGEYTVVHSGNERQEAATVPEELERVSPLRWYEAERVTLTTLILQAAESGADSVAWDLAAVCRCLFSTRGHYDDWLLTHERALQAVREKGNRRGAAALLLGLGDLHYTKRQFATCVPLLNEAKSLFESVQDGYGAALVLRKLACVDRISGRFEQALARWQECLPVLRETGDLEAQTQVLRWSAQMLLELRRPDDAEWYLGKAREITRSFNGRSSGQVRFAMADLYRVRGQLDPAEAEYRAGHSSAADLGDLVGQSYALFGLGATDLHRHSWSLAEEQMQGALALARQARDPLLESVILMGLAAAHLSAGRSTPAGEALCETVLILRRLGAPVRLAHCLRALANVKDEEKNHTEATRLREEAADLIRAVGSKLAADSVPAHPGELCPVSI
ncbi:BTAD domain-containing putative transcriptional regulator [Streptomyces sp. NPDC056486]|uniref:AfsR/SARP family transcriptional regulator n=1 Tax=Streptomyces sp. NPDC056486 TaxID=3345835 RepID=UPI0036A81A85